MDLVFCGTPEFAAPTLALLVERGHCMRLVVTQPDRPRGRGLKVEPSPVKELAATLGLPVAQPETIRDNAGFRAQLETAAPRAIVMIGYGRMIPPWMIALPPLGNINLHASLLPRYRGAAPIQWAIARGESRSGVTTMRIDAGLDTGDILLQRETEITPDDTALTLTPRLAEMGSELMLETLAGLEAGRIQPRPQEHAQATLAPILKKEDGRIDFQRTAVETCNRLRGFQPWPGQYTRFRGKQLNLWAAHPLAAGELSLEPGTIGVEGERLFAGGGGSTALEILELQPEGKKRMPARDFVHGYRPQSGERLGA